ncbi:MAG: DUF523 and DUF1722 domain-containing protein [Pseudomonadota bacterium]|nr:DUF523 and DUF1722 domain-containing protein [Pseudomonadota bacterium]
MNPTLSPTGASHSPPRVNHEISIGVSSCLLGESVRYNGGHKRDRFVADILASYFQLIPVCPEVAVGMGVPREPIRLELRDAQIRAVGVKDKSRDMTQPLREYGRRMAAELPSICGYIFKSKSPSCGVERVKVYVPGGRPLNDGRGVYAAEIAQARPLLPIEEEGRLNDSVLRENFIERVFAFHRWQQFLANSATAERLVEFHTAHKLVLMAHGTQRLRELGRLVAKAGSEPIADLVEEYGRAFMLTLSYRATRKRHSNVLFHAMGYLKKHLNTEDKQELTNLIHSYRTAEVPLIVPVTLLRHHFRVHPHPYIEKQLYFQWAPAGLSLWNSI